MDKKRRLIEMLYKQACFINKNMKDLEELDDLFEKSASNKILNREKNEKNDEILMGIYNKSRKNSDEYSSLQQLLNKYYSRNVKYKLGDEEIEISGHNGLAKAAGISVDILKNIISNRTKTIGCIPYIAIAMVLNFSIEDYLAGESNIRSKNEDEENAFEFGKRVILFNLEQNRLEDKYNWEYVREFLYEKELITIPEEKNRRSKSR